MQTIQLQIQDSLYRQLIQSGVDIEEKMNELLYEMLDDGYPAIDHKRQKKELLMVCKDTEAGQCK